MKQYTTQRDWGLQSWLWWGTGGQYSENIELSRYRAVVDTLQEILRRQLDEKFSPQAAIDAKLVNKMLERWWNEGDGVTWVSASNKWRAAAESKIKDWESSRKAPGWNIQGSLLQRLLDFKKYSAANRAAKGKALYDTFTTDYLEEMMGAIDRLKPTTIEELHNVFASLIDQQAISTTIEKEREGDETRYNEEFVELQSRFIKGGNRGDVKRNHKRVQMGDGRPWSY